MPATPARVAIALNDGVLLSRADPTIKAANYNAVSNDTEIESFFDLATDAQAVLDERWAWQSVAGRPREQVEVDSSFNLGTKIALAPKVPTITLTDTSRSIVGVACKVRAYAIDYNSERYAVELIG